MGNVTLRVQFTVCGEFLDELARDPPPDKVLRVAKMAWRARRRDSFVHILLVAGYINRAGQLVELRASVGQDSAFDLTRRAEILGRSDELLVRVQDAASRIGLEVRSGVFSPR